MKASIFGQKKYQMVLNLSAKRLAFMTKSSVFPSKGLRGVILEVIKLRILEQKKYQTARQKVLVVLVITVVSLVELRGEDVVSVVLFLYIMIGHNANIKV